jgi:DNA-binding NarL/FixJ family response regulator
MCKVDEVLDVLHSRLVCQIKKDIKSAERKLLWKPNEAQAWKKYLERKYAELREAEKKFEHAKEQIIRNVGILFSTWDSRRGVGLRRKRFAIYRLFSLGLTPRDIAYLMDVSEEQAIKHHIGEAFKEVCISDEKCVFKPFFQAESK